MNTSLQSQLLSLYGEHQLSEQQAKQQKQDEYRLRFEKIVLEAKDTMIDELKKAASNGRKWLSLVGNKDGSHVSHFVDMERVRRIDRSKLSTLRNVEWRSVHRYCDKDVLRNDALVELWEYIEGHGLKPIFIEREYGAPIFGVEFIESV